MTTIEKILENELKRLTPEERGTLREDVLLTFDTIYKNINNRMNTYENTILDTVIQRNKELSIVNMIVPKEDFYLYEEYFSPVMIGDTNQTSILSTLQTDEKLYEKLVYVGEMENIDAYNEKELDAKISFEGRTFLFKLKLLRDTSYEKKIDELYRTFQLNSLRWKTVNAPYLSRIFKLVIVDHDEDFLEEMSKISNSTHLYKLEIESSEILQNFAQDYISVWNITPVQKFGNGVIEPTENRINYIHSIDSRENVDLYLVPEQGIHVYSVGKTSMGYRVVTDTNKNITWNFVSISDVSQIAYEEKLTYPIFKNQEISLFINKLRELNKVRIRTVAEIHRIIHSYQNIKNRFELVDVKVTDKMQGAVETKDLDFFIVDEFKLKKDTKYMYLYFKVLKNDVYLIEELSFIVTIMQSFFPEYQCKGVLV